MSKGHNARITILPQITIFNSDADTCEQLDRRDIALAANRRKFRQKTSQVNSFKFGKIAYAVTAFLFAIILFLLTYPG